jgi:hypothetical protein
MIKFSSNDEHLIIEMTGSKRRNIYIAALTGLSLVSLFFAVKALFPVLNVLLGQLKVTQVNGDSLSYIPLTAEASSFWSALGSCMLLLVVIGFLIYKIPVVKREVSDMWDGAYEITFSILIGLGVSAIMTSTIFVAMVIERTNHDTVSSYATSSPEVRSWISDNIGENNRYAGYINDVTYYSDAKNHLYRISGVNNDGEITLTISDQLSSDEIVDVLGVDKK